MKRLPRKLIATVEIKNRRQIRLLKKYKAERDWNYNMSIREALRLLAAQERSQP
jgi:hypothetical protein